MVNSQLNLQTSRTCKSCGRLHAIITTRLLNKCKSCGRLQAIKLVSEVKCKSCGRLQAIKLVREIVCKSCGRLQAIKSVGCPHHPLHVVLRNHSVSWRDFGVAFSKFFTKHMTIFFLLWSFKCIMLALTSSLKAWNIYLRFLPLSSGLSPV